MAVTAPDGARRVPAGLRTQRGRTAVSPGSQGTCRPALAPALLGGACSSPVRTAALPVVDKEG